MAQYRVAHVRPSADGRMITAVIVDRDWKRITQWPDVQVLEYTNDGPLARFPARMLVGGCSQDEAVRKLGGTP